MAGTRGKSEYVDISSNTQVVKLYKKKGRVKRAVSLVLAIIFMVTGAGMIYYYNALDSIVYEVEETKPTEATQEYTGESGVDEFKTAVTDSSLLSNPKVLNVMLFGEDNHSKGSSGRSDSSGRTHAGLFSRSR